MPSHVCKPKWSHNTHEQIDQPSPPSANEQIVEIVAGEAAQNDLSATTDVNCFDSHVAQVPLLTFATGTPRETKNHSILFVMARNCVGPSAGHSIKQN